MSAAGGDPKRLTEMGANHLAHRWPQVLRDGRVLLFVRSNDPDVQGIYVTSVARPGELRQIRATTAERYGRRRTICCSSSTGSWLRSRLDPDNAHAVRRSRPGGSQGEHVERDELARLRFEQRRAGDVEQRRRPERAGVVRSPWGPAWARPVRPTATSISASRPMNGVSRSPASTPHRILRISACSISAGTSSPP